MHDQAENMASVKTVFDDRNLERRLWSCLGQTCSRSLVVLLSQSLVILFVIFGCFWRIRLTKTCGKPTVWVGILCGAAGTFYHRQSYEQFKFYKNCIFISLVGPSNSGKTY